MQKKQQIQQKSRLGTLLIHKGLISRQQLDEALVIQAKMGLRLGEVLIQNGWLTEKQLNKALRNQSRYRLVAALGALLLGPMQPFMANAQPAENTVTSEQFIERTGIKQLSEQELAGIAGQGTTNIQSSYEKLLDVVNNDLDTDDEAFASTTLESLAAFLIPGTNLLDAEMEVSGVEYEPGPRTTINADGSLDLQLPTNIKKVAFRNVRIAGSEGQHLGDVVVKDLSFGAGTSVKIHLH